MKQQWKRAVAALLALALTLLPACSKPDEKDGGQAQAMGRYVEEEYLLPTQAGTVRGMWQRTDGALEMIANGDKKTNMGPWFLWRSEDGGKTWSKPDCPWIKNFDTDSLSDVASTPDGTYYIYYTEIPEIVRKAIDEGTDPSTLDASLLNFQEILVKINPDGTQSQMDFELPVDENGSGVGSIAVADNGDLLIGTFFTLHQVDPNTGEVKNTFVPENGLLRAHLSFGDTLMIDDNGTFVSYSLTTGEKLESINALEGSERSKIGYSGDLGKTPRLLAFEQDEDALYYCDQSGIYRHLMQGGIVERAVDGSMTSLSMPSINFSELFVRDDGSFLVLVSGESQMSLLRYRFDKDVPTVPDKELRVYSLYENKTVRQAVGLYQRANPDVHVIYEPALTNGDGATAADALRTLSTELVGGKGPDVLVLDGLPMESYEEKGVLADLSGEVASRVGSGEWLENIANSFVREDGAVYAVPARIVLPLMLTDEEAASRSELTAFVDLMLQREGEKENGGAIGEISPNTLIRQFYTGCAPAWIGRDGTLDEQGLRTFLTDLKRLCDELGEGEEAYAAIDQNADYAFEATFGSLSWCYEKMAANIGNIKSFETFMPLYAAIDKAGGGKIVLQPGQTQGRFYLPQCVMGINAAGGNQEIALDFLRMTLSQEVQSNDFKDGLPANALAMETGIKSPYSKYDDGMYYSTSDGDGISMELHAKWPSEARMNEVAALIHSLDTPAMVSEQIMQILMDESKGYFAGTKSLDDTMTAVSEKMKLYLAE